MTRILAVASGGGHWDQLMMLRDVIDSHQAAYATTNIELAKIQGISNAHQLPDCNLDQPLRSLWCLLCTVRLVIRLRPNTIITTGAGPGLFCILIGRLIGSRTLWIDSVANAERMSLSGRIARHIAHVCLTQWEHLEADGGPIYSGSVL